MVGGGVDVGTEDGPYRGVGWGEEEAEGNGDNWGRGGEERAVNTCPKSCS